jgi:hypothetical protein
MRGDETPRTALQKIISDRHCQRGAFFRVGRRAQLIQQNQRRRIRQLRDTLKVGDMSGKGGQVLFNRLRIPNVGQKRIEERKYRLRGRHWNSRLRHHPQQPGRLQRHRLAAGIGTADDQLPLRIV